MNRVKVRTNLKDAPRELRRVASIHRWYGAPAAALELMLTRRIERLRTHPAFVDFSDDRNWDDYLRGQEVSFWLSPNKCWLPREVFDRLPRVKPITISGALRVSTILKRKQGRESLDPSNLPFTA